MRSLDAIDIESQPKSVVLIKQMKISVSVIKRHFYSNLSAIKVIEQTKFNGNEEEIVAKKPTQIMKAVSLSKEAL